jgi:hypothetical protein
VGKIHGTVYQQQPGVLDGSTRVWHPTKDDLKAVDWEVMKDPPAGTPTWASKQLQEGHKIRRVSWNDGWYVGLDRDDHLMLYEGPCCANSFHPDIDLVPGLPNWELYKEPVGKPKEFDTHDWGWAAKALFEGRAVARLGWVLGVSAVLSNDGLYYREATRDTRVAVVGFDFTTSTDWVLGNDLRRSKKPAPNIRLLPTEIDDCRDCFAFRESPSHNLACAHARLYNNATERQQYIVPKRNAAGVYQPLDDCPLKKKGQQ